ncbi:GMC family oxidoreductase [Rhodopirellula sp. P2]|uniref:GMC family oxidoreductase n=1 Tax=Rhodopirellula sp. P2 TaxID=2127060 RepID=UPI0023688DD1|nr:GMC family oxidoreductase [Rhodopirellula sp. P2]WDQ14722.1 GMC family oxidoreductase [Rhodopirellula sp. P2]
MNSSQRPLSFPDSIPAKVDRPDQFSDGIVILGGGLCGLLLAHELARLAASRLGADAPRIWVIESPCGEVARRDQQRPVRWLRLLGGEADYQYRTQPADALAGRSIPWPRGKGLGGSGRINSMIWFPPTAAEIRSLATFLVSKQSPNDNRLIGDSPTDAEQQLQRAFDRSRQIIRPEQARWLSPTSEAFLKAVSGRISGDFAAYDRLNRNGRRWTAVDAIADLCQSNAVAANRIRVVRAQVSSLEINDGVVAGIRWSDGRTSLIANDAEVVSSLGAIASPTLLHRSGLTNPQIGENLHDHLIMPVVHSHDGPAFSDSSSDMTALAQWQHAGRGPIACNVAECGGLDESHRWQLHVTPTDYLRFPNDTRRPAMTIGVNVTRPHSRGRLDWTPDETLIDAGYWNDDRDRVGLLDGVRWVRELVQQSGFDRRLRSEMIPGAKRQTDEAITAAMARYSQTLYHPAGTCALGSVVDSNFRVRGITNLSVVDASLLPEPTTGNPTATLAMLACYAATQLVRQ